MLAYRILGIGFCDDDSQVRAAYLNKTKEYSPEKYPDEYQSIRKAYELIETHQKRLEYFIAGNDMDFNLDEYKNVCLTTQKSVNKERWDTLCKMYQESK